MSLRTTFLSGGVIASMLLATGCPQREVAEVPPVPAPVPDKRIPVQINRNVDILFVVDNSGSMQEEQDSLKANFSKFIEVLQNIDGGLPDVHIGVVTTDVGDDGNGACAGGVATAGALIQTPDGQPYIEDFSDGNGGRTTNYTGTLTDTFSQMASVGITGCGFEAPLESMRKALDGSQPGNAGFLRDDAFLAVIIISDEDDCSVSDRDAFFANQNAGVDDPLGPFTSFRCFEFGITCEDQANIREFGAKENCVPQADSPYLFPVQDYIDFLKSVKNENLIIVAGITGPAEQSASGTGFRTNVRPDPDPAREGLPELAPSCEATGLGSADPAIRTNQFITSFRESSSTSICGDDLSVALVNIANLLAEVIGTPCLSENIAQPPDCIGWTENPDGSNQQLVPLCGSPPCYEFLDPSTVQDQCDGRLGVQYNGDGTEDPFTVFRLQCVGEAN